jgi:CRP-like cAMP-binding protein
MIMIMSKAMVDHFELFPHEELSFEAGQTVFSRDSAVEWLHHVQSGTVQLRRFSSDGCEMVLQRAEAGFFLAEASLFSPRYHCDAIATTPAILRRFRKRDVVAAIGENPEIALAWSRYLSAEVQRTRAQAELLSLKRLPDRLSAWLDLHDGKLPPKGQWRSVAREIGVTPEALYRHLATRRN